MRELKGQFQFTISRNEELIERQLNEFNKKEVTEHDLGPLQTILALVKAESTNVINKFYPLKGMAFITFSRRKEAEKAIAVAGQLDSEWILAGAWDRGVPEYFYHTRLL